MHDGKRVVITYGTYDLLHFGHIALLERARALGDFLIVGVTSDAFDKQRGKLNVRQSLADRVKALEKTGLADMIIVEEYRGQKIADIEKYSVDVFTVGSDWTGKFDYLKKYCDVVYLERTKGVSSTELRAEDTKILKLGCIGLDYLAERLVRESSHVGGIMAVAGYDRDAIRRDAFCARNALKPFGMLREMFAEVDAVYISCPVDERVDYIVEALDAGCHVLCEGPLFVSLADADRVRRLAAEKNLVVMEAVKTRYFPAFQRMKLLIESGIIGDVKDVDASFSHVFDDLDRTDKHQGSFYDMASYILLPAIDLIGCDYKDVNLICSYDGDFCLWTKCSLLFESASATLRVGRGIKTEGDMVITGTDGYLYVPAPWWKIEYFEHRAEDLRDAKKYYFECAGEGQRYELFEFVNRVGGAWGTAVSGCWGDVLAVTKIVEKFDKGEVSSLKAGKYSFGGGEIVS